MTKWLFLVFTLVTSLRIEAQISDFEHISFKNADNIASFYKGDDLHNLPELAYKLTNKLSTDVEKFRAIYIWVSTNIECDYPGVLKNHTKRTKFQKDSLKLNHWNKTFSDAVHKKLLKEKRTVCTGYAYLIKKLANLAHIRCEIIDGYGRTEDTIDKESNFPNHSWNGVQLNGKWYLCDATWSSGAYDLNSHSFEFDYNDGYFLANPQLFAKNHFPVDASWFLLPEKPMLPVFLKAPLLYGKTFIHNIIPMEPAQMSFETQKNKEAVFVLKELKNIDTKAIYLQVVSRNNTKIVWPKVTRTKEGFIQIKHPFTTYGSYDTHITINKDIICTYVVKVKR